MAAMRALASAGRNPPDSFRLEERLNIAHHPIVVPSFRADDFLDDAARLVDDVAFGNLGGSVLRIDLLFAVPRGLERDGDFPKKLTVCVLILINADAEHHQALA